MVQGFKAGTLSPLQRFVVVVVVNDSLLVLLVVVHWVEALLGCVM